MKQFRLSPLPRILLLLAAITSSTITASAAPNVVLIMCDDLGYGDIYSLHQNTRDNGAGGGTAGDGLINGSEEAFIYTPNIDRMAAEGATLTRHYTSAPVCAPARGSLLQGRDQGHANIRNNEFDKAVSDNHTLGTIMQSAGYYTAVVGKWGIGGSTGPNGVAHPNNRGFDYFYGMMGHGQAHQHYPGNNGSVMEQTTQITSSFVTSNPSYDLTGAYSTDLWIAKAKDIIQDRTNNHASQPFFIYVAITAPHAQLQVPTQAYPPGSGTGGGLTWPLNTRTGGTQNAYIHPDYSSLSNSPARHATMIRRIDDGIGDILQTLRDLGIDDNTLVVLTSDNGTHNESGIGGSVAHNPQNFDSYGIFEGIKRDCWEGGVRMPTFAWWPTQIGDGNQVTPGLEASRPSAFWDWMPTFAEAAGLTPPAWSSGVSLLPELTGSGTQQDKGYLYFEYNVNGRTPSYADFPTHGGASRGQMQAIHMDDTDGKRYKGIRTSISSHSQDFLIYDVDADPAEATNLAPGKPALQQAMKDRVLQVRIDGDTSRAYLTNQFAPSASPGSVVNGLNYKAYTGNWSWVPETAYLSPVSNGTSTGLDLNVRPQNDNVLLEYTGYISLPSEGTYTFQMTTDSTVNSNASGGMLWIHDAHIIDDDFNHDGTAQSGSMRLQAGLHPIRILYKHSSGSHDINLKYSGPGISLQDVPSTILFREASAGPQPIANPDVATAAGAVLISIPVLANDTDDGLPSALSIQSVDTPEFGTSLIDGNTIRYTANLGNYGIDQFYYTITDGESTARALVSVTITDPRVETVLLNTNFTGFSTSGTTISSFEWSSNEGEAENATTSLSLSGSASGFRNVNPGNGGSGPAVGVSGNIETVGPWNTSFTFTPSRTYDISSFEISSYSINSNGAHQSNAHPVTWILTIASNGNTLFNGSDSVNEPRGDAPAQFAINTAGTTLEAGTTYTFSLDVSSSSSAGNNIALDALTLRQLPRAATNSSLWNLLYFGNSAPTEADWLLDTDNDGTTRLQEYAFGGNPHLFDSSSVLPTTIYNENTSKLEVTYTQRAPDTHNLIYTIEVSEDLTNWTLPFTQLSALPHPSLGSDFLQVIIETENTNPPREKEFVRVRVEIDDSTPPPTGNATYAATDVPVSISPDTVTIYTSALQLTGIIGTIADLNLTLDITHTWASDLDIALISPDGTRVPLANGQGGNGDNYTNTTFDQEAGTSIVGQAAPFTGSFRPQGDLSTLYGSGANGTWTLEVGDDFAEDGGTLNAWSLEITTE